MKNTKLKIDNFFENKLENLAVIKGGDEGTNPLPADPSGGGSNTTGGGGSGEHETPPPPPFPPIDPRNLSPAPGTELQP